MSKSYFYKGWEIVRRNEPSERVLDAFAKACYDLAVRAVERGYVPPQKQTVDPTEQNEAGSRGV